MGTYVIPLSYRKRLKLGMNKTRNERTT